MNFSHGTHEEYQKKIDLIKEVREELGLPIAIMLDTKGPEYRIKTFENGSIKLNDGDTFNFTTEDIVGNQERVSVTYERLIDELNIGDKIITFCLLNGNRCKSQSDYCKFYEWKNCTYGKSGNTNIIKVETV